MRLLERDVGSFPGGHGADVLNLDLAGDDLVAQCGHDQNNKLETILALVGGQNAQMISPVPKLSGATSQSQILSGGSSETQHAE